MAERAVAPGVLHHHTEVGGTLHDYEQWPLEPRAALCLGEEPRVRFELVVQPPPQQLRHHLRRTTARVAQHRHDAKRNER